MKICNECKQPLDYQHDDRCAERHPSADYDLTQPLTPPNVGKLGQAPEQFEKERIARTDFGFKEGESWDHPEETRATIASMAASRAPALVRAHNSEPGRALRVRSEPEIHAPPANVPAEVGLMVHAAVRELSRELRGTMEELIHDVNANTRLLGVINAPMEAITGAHERASASFETLRRDILGGGMDKLEQVLDVSGLSEQASKTEQRLEALVLRLEAKIDGAVKSISTDMVAVLNLLAKMHSRELHKAKRRKFKKVAP